MARIRTIKPEFWTDDLLGSLSREARLLFIATWNLADDEGLLRWSAPFLKGAVFPFDDDLSVKDVQKLMEEVCAAGIVFWYVGGRSQQPLGYIVNFLKHQKINRPGPSRLPPPPLTDQKVKAMYAARDGNICHLCCLPLDAEWSEKYQSDFTVSPDHLTPQSAGGSDFPSNIKAAHLTCNKGKRDRTTEQYIELLRNGSTTAQKRYPERFTNYSMNHSVMELGAGNRDMELDLVSGPSTVDQDLGSPSLRSGSAPKKKSRRSLPDNFPELSDLTWAQELWLKYGRSDLCGTMAEEQEKFRDHHNGKLTASADWPASWRTWARNAIKFSNGAHNGKRNGKQSSHDKFFEGVAGYIDSLDGGPAESQNDRGGTGKAIRPLLSR